MLETAMKICLLPFLFLVSYCRPDETHPRQQGVENASPVADSLLLQRFAPPSGFDRIVVDSGSFAFYLRHLPLKPTGSEVLLYDGRTKENDGVYAAVVDLPIGNKDLHQCADAVIRLRAEYLWRKKAYDQIHFNLTNGFRVDYDRWRKGERIKVAGNRTEWVQKATPSDAYAGFWQYLELVFTYAGTLSLAKELKPASLADIRIGDVFIRGGSPGHAVIVVDIAADKKGKKMFLLAQSYMAAQEIQILQNPNDAHLSPWYDADFEGALKTPEWVFEKAELKRF